MHWHGPVVFLDQLKNKNGNTGVKHFQTVRFYQDMTSIAWMMLCRLGIVKGSALAAIFKQDIQRIILTRENGYMGFSGVSMPESVFRKTVLRAEL